MQFTNTIVINTICRSFDSQVKKSVQAVIDAESPFKIAELAALQGTWDGEKREVSV